MVVYVDEYEKFMLMEEEERSSFEKVEVEGEVQEIEWFLFCCIKCFKLFFSIVELLCMYYIDYYSWDLKRDFIILGNGFCLQNFIYQCKYCDSKL